jgi:hypothetical protein
MTADGYGKISPHPGYTYFCNLKMYAVFVWLMLPFSGTVESLSGRVYPRVFEMSSYRQCFSRTFNILQPRVVKSFWARIYA